MKCATCSQPMTAVGDVHSCPTCGFSQRLTDLGFIPPARPVYRPPASPFRPLPPTTPEAA